MLGVRLGTLCTDAGANTGVLDTEVLDTERAGVCRDVGARLVRSAKTPAEGFERELERIQPVGLNEEVEGVVAC